MLPYDNDPETLKQMAQMMAEENLQAKERHQQNLQNPEYQQLMKKLAKNNNNPFLNPQKQS